MTFTERRYGCPFPVLSSLFVAIVFASGSLTLLFPPFSTRLPLLGSVVATCVVGVAVETLRRKPTTCPWLEFGHAGRGVLYLTLFAVALFVVSPGVWPNRDVLWPLRIPFVVLSIAMVALLRIHRKVDHGELEEAGIGRWLYAVSRLPLFLLVAMVAFLVLIALMELVAYRS